MRNVACLADFFRIEDASMSDKIAFYFQDQPITYDDLDKSSNRFAQAFIKAGIQTNDRIAIMDKNSGDFPSIFGGALKARATLVPLNFRLTGEEVEFILSDSGSKIVFIGSEFKSIAYQLKEKLPEISIVFLQYVEAEGSAPEIPSIDSWLQGCSTDEPGLANQATDHAIQLYTSGTTGNPKGVYHSSAHYLKGFKGLAEATTPIRAEEIQLICMPLCHIAGLSNLINGLVDGACSVIMREFIAEEVFEVIPKYQINTTLFAPVIIQMLLNMPQAETTDFSSLKRIFYGSAPISQTVIERAQVIFDCDFWQLYGMTENIGMATYLPPEDHAADRDKLLSCGLPYPGSQLRIVDGNGNDIPTGEVGEIITKSDWTMPEYWNRPEATKQTIIDGWLHTGDAGYFDDEGYLYIHDRMKDMIISGGENVYPAEVENVLFAHPAIAEAAVFGVPDDKWGEAVKAMVVLKPGQQASAEDIINFTREKIAGYKTPKSIGFIEALPRNTAGKVLRRELRAPYWEGKDRAIS